MSHPLLPIYEPPNLPNTVTTVYTTTLSKELKQFSYDLQFPDEPPSLNFNSYAPLEVKSPKTIHLEGPGVPNTPEGARGP